MDQVQHQRILATFHLIFGVVGLIILLLFRLFFGVLFPVISEAIADTEPIAEIFVSFGFELLRFVGYFLLFGTILPSIIGAIGFLQNQSWGIYLLLLSGCLRLINFPLGTALGVYTLWVFFRFQNQQNQ
jgi:ABC-type polysaccharide/polyol phosphate export permease